MCIGTVGVDVCLVVWLLVVVMMSGKERKERVFIRGNSPQRRECAHTPRTDAIEDGRLEKVLSRRVKHATSRSRPPLVVDPVFFWVHPPLIPLCSLPLIHPLSLFPSTPNATVCLLSRPARFKFRLELSLKKVRCPIIYFCLFCSALLAAAQKARQSPTRFGQTRHPVSSCFSQGKQKEKCKRIDKRGTGVVGE
jgi:hypothetical protein